MLGGDIRIALEPSPCGCSSEWFSRSRNHQRLIKDQVGPNSAPPPVRFGRLSPPQHWKCGRLRRADAVAFVRFDDFNTQYRMPAGVAPNGAGGREEWTFGITYLPIPTSAIKFDYQVRSDAAVADLADKVNFGVGFMF